MKIRVRVLFSAIGFSLTLASLGCGSGSTTPPPVGAIAGTTNPLVAQYNITHFDWGLSAWVEFGTGTNYGRETSIATSSSARLTIQKVSILVAGMKPQTTYHMRAHVKWLGGEWVDQDQTFKTGAIPASSPLPQFSVTSASGSPSGGVELLSLVNSGSVFPDNEPIDGMVTDLQGNIIWYCPGLAIPFKPLDNGHYLFMRGDSEDEVDLACNVIRTVTVDQVNQSLQAQGYSFGPISAFHHDMLVLPNGHWILLGNVSKDTVTGDALVDVDPNGNVVWGWSTFDHLDVNRALFGLPDWTHSNALVFTADGNLLLSMRNQSWIIKIDYANGTGTGNVLWRLGEGGDFTLLGADSSQWFYAQHFPAVVSVNGSKTTLSIYDNGDFRIGSDGVACGPPVPPTSNCYTRATIFEVDESTNVANLVWQHSPGFFSFWGGSIEVLDSGNVEFDSSAYNGFQVASQINEVTQTDSPQTVWQMTITGANAYRGYRIPSLYPGVKWKQ